MTSARYRVTINGFKVNTETWDHALEVDGKRDEVFISYRTSLTNPRGDVLFVADDLSAVMGDTNQHPGRVRAGSASRHGGIRTDDSFPSPTPWRHDGHLADDNPPMLVWEGELSSTEGEIFALAPSIWEWDGGGDSFDEWVSWANEAIKKIGTFVTPFLGGTATAKFGGIELGLGLAVSLSERGILGQARNRPIGMITKEGKSYKFDQPILAFNYETAERLLKTNPTGRGNGILPFTFKDHEDLGGGTYVLYVQLEKVGQEPGRVGAFAPGALVTAVARKQGHLDIWVTGDGRIYTAYYNDTGIPWNGWHQVIGPVPSGVPAGAPVTAVARKPGHLDIWVTGNDGRIYTAYYNDAGVPWNGWHEVIGPVPSGVPAGAPVTAVARKEGHLDIWVVGNDGAVYTAYYNDTGIPWNGWHQVIGPVPSGVPAGAPLTAVARKPGHLDIWVVGNDGRVYCAYYNDAGIPWNGWHEVIGSVPSGLPAGAPVTALARSTGQLDIWVTGNDDRVYMAFYNDAAVPWNGWHQVIGPVPSGVPAGAPVTAVARKEGHLDIWVVGNDGRVYCAYYNDAGIPWNGWHQVIGPVPSGVPAGAPVTAVARKEGHLDIWVTGNDGRVYTAYYNDANIPWNGWHALKPSGG